MDPLLLIKSLWPGSRSSMLEPSPRYSPSVGGLVDSHRNLDTAVDLSRKSVPPPPDIEPDEPEDSEDEAPLDLKVRTVNMSESLSPPPVSTTPLQRAEFLRIAEMVSQGKNSASRPLLPPSNNHSLHHRGSRESSLERELASRCEYCGEESESPDFIPSDHGQGICQRGSLACSLCPKTFTQWAQLNDHKKNHHQKLKQRHYPCQSCGKVFTSASNRNMHQRIHKGVRPFQCTPCGVYFRQKAHLQKHQKTQGHLQASELKEKNRLLECPPNNNNNNNKNSGTPHGEEESGSAGEEGECNISSSSSTTTSSVGNSLADDSSIPPPDSSTSQQLKRSSPKRKQLRPRRTPDESSSSTPVRRRRNSSSTSSSTLKCDESILLENKIRSFVHYNESSHGYECQECSFSSHELSTLKGHVRGIHLRWDEEDSLKCRDCVISFPREFNLRIHNKKHENESGALHCDVCDAIFKVPHFLLKHMEDDHLACPSCGCIQDDKDSLLRHSRDCLEDSCYYEDDEEEMEEDLISVMDEDDSGVGVGNESILPSPSPLTSTPNIISKENRDAKKRKVDSLAESIRLKQELQRNNNNNVQKGSKRPFLSPIPGRTKTDMSNIRALLSRPPDPPSGLNALMNHITSKISPNNYHHLHENNNHLKPGGLSPPASPPPPNTTTISGSMSVKLVKGPPNHSHHHHHHEDHNMGLDLTVGRRHRHDSLEEDHHHPKLSVGFSNNSFRSAVGRSFPPSHPSFPPHLNSFSFFGLPPPGADPAFAENLLKLAAGLPAAPLHPPLHRPQDLKLPSPSSSSSLPNSYIISAALGSSSLPTVFPGLPPTLIPTRPHPPSSLHEKDLTGGIGSRSSSLMEARSNSSSSSSAPSSSNKPFRCTFCRKEFGHLSSLDSHMEHMHSGESKHTCEACGKSFSSKSNLTAHKKIHSGERPFECLVCHKRFRQKAHLQKHETTHSSATPYKCSICDKAFGHPSNLNTHMATHSNIRPYSCSECGKSYKDSASFKRHRASHSGSGSPPQVGSNSSLEGGNNINNPCSSCNESFMDLSSLRKHMESVHPGGDPCDSIGEEDEHDEEESISTSGETPHGKNLANDSSGYSSSLENNNNTTTKGIDTTANEIKMDDSK
uniref:C2H2-type domain-containing protein n=1 Tax=Lepeophtheirus salmonis TaxID=72036 RepID=A0A0K2UH38_LEPSM